MTTGIKARAILPHDLHISSPLCQRKGRRRPSHKLKGTRITGDIMSPAVPEGDWDSPK